VRPDRRFLWQGLYLPGRHSEDLGKVLLAVDTSGSIDQTMIALFTAEIESICEGFPDVELVVWWHDTEVRHEQRWKASDGPFVPEPKGGGGTDHRPLFEKVQRDGEDVACVVCLTDMETWFPDVPPPVPVLWASVLPGKTAPFGRVVEVTHG
jgi:predicted metal-dependent peptidase